MTRTGSARLVLADTGPLVAILSPRDSHHAKCVEALKQIKLPLHCCWPVITECAWLLRDDPRGLAGLWKLLSTRMVTLLPLDAEDVPAIAGIMARYLGLKLQLADAAILHLADRERLTAVFTLDQRDFRVVRLSRGKALKLLPDF